MGLLNPFFLIGSLILAVPVLIHLVRKERSEVIPFSTLMFLLKVPKRSIRQQKLKNLLLMLLRLLILALLVGVFARPYLTQSATPTAAGDLNRGVVLLIDNSYSTRYGNNFDRMKNEAATRIDGLGNSDQMAVIAFNDTATVIANPTNDKEKLKAAVAALEPSFGGTRFYEAFSLADRMLTQFAGSDKELVMISDFQRVGWNRSSRESVIGRDVKTEMVNIGVENSTNLGIDSVGAPATTFTRTYTDRVVARIHNHSKDKAATVPVSLSLNDKEVLRRTVTVSANSTALAEFTGFDLNLGLNRGRVRIETNEDPLTVDNDFLFSLDRRDRLNILIVDGGRTRQQSFVLRQAFSSGGSELPYAVQVIPAASLTVDELGKHAVVIFNDVARLSTNITARMDELRKTSQGQFVILAENADLEWWSGYAKLPVKPTRRIFVQKDRGRPSMAITSFERNHSIFKPFETSSNFAINTAQFLAFVQVEAKPGAVVLAKFEDGSPALTESGADDRGLIVFNSKVDVQSWNDLIYKPSFVPLFHEIVRYLTRYSETRGSYALGEGVPVVGTIEAAAAAVINPDGERQALGELAPGQQRFFTPMTPGFYETRVGKESHLIAVNPPAAEGNLDGMPPEDLLASVQRLDGEAQQGEGLFAGDGVDEYARRQTAWWYLLMIALLAVIAEIYLANKNQRAQQVEARKA